MKNASKIFGKIPPDKQLLYSGKLNTTEELYLFHVAPIPTVCHAKVFSRQDFCRVKLILMAHDRYLTLEEVASAKDNLFDEDEIVAYLFDNSHPNIGTLPDSLVHPMIHGTNRPQVTMFQVPSTAIPDIEKLITRFEFFDNAMVCKSRTIEGKKCVIVYCPQTVPTFDFLKVVAKEYFDEAIMFHKSKVSLLNTSNVYILWDKADFPDLDSFLE